MEHEVDPDALRSLEARAAELGIKIPASFVEWCCMRGAIDLLGRITYDADAIPLERLGERFEWRWEEDEDIDWVRKNLLLFMFENQAVCVWAIRLDADDDPPVVVAVDPNLAWVQCAERFSTFVACQVWDSTEVFGERIQLQAQAVELNDTDLALLRERFGEVPTTHGWPGRNQYRFQRGDHRVLIWDSAGQADWHIAASSEDALAELAAELWQCGDLHESLWSHDARGDAVLRRLRSQLKA